MHACMWTNRIVELCESYHGYGHCHCLRQFKSFPSGRSTATSSLSVIGCVGVVIGMRPLGIRQVCAPLLKPRLGAMVAGLGGHLAERRRCEEGINVRSTYNLGTSAVLSVHDPYSHS